jgi:hypothetical protein
MSKSSPQKVLSDAAMVASKVIAQAAAGALETIKEAAADALKKVNVKNEDGTNDHDTLIEIKTVQHTMLSEIREMKDGYTKRLDGVEISVDSLNASRDNINGGLKWAGVVMSVLVGVVSWLYISQQNVQDTRIDNLTKQVNKIP